VLNMETLKTKYIDLPTMAKYLRSVGPNCCGTSYPIHGR